MRYRILGTFNAKLSNNHNDQRNGVFTGSIHVDEKGNFSGDLEDCWGPSTIKGFLDEKELSFEKTYLGREARPVKYFLLRRDVMSGWSGTWNTEGPDPSNGLAICALFS